MDIVIHATKDGYRTLYSTNSDLAYLIAKDMRSGANDDQPLGQSAYSVSFIASGTVFTKYTIVKDALRSNALGTIAYSLFLNFNKVLEGKNIVRLLEDLSTNYSENYIKNNYLNRGEKVLIREEWGFVSTILGKYKEQEINQKETEIQSGSNEAAFIYYNSTAELEEYFDKPFQEEYTDYKQVLFVNENLKGNLNPLNVLTNSEVELKNIDLKNEYFYLNNYSHTKRITILANGKERSERKNNNSIRFKSEVEIKYIKDEKCFFPIEAKGTLSNPNSEIFKYLELRGNNVIIKYDAFNNPPKRDKSIIFEILDYKGDFIDNAEIKIGYRNGQKIIGHQYKYTFEGEELIGSESISIRKDNFSAVLNDFIPQQADERLVITLTELKTVELDIRDEDSGNHLLDFEVSTKLTNGYQRIKQLEFVDEQIADSYNIKIRKHGFDDKEFNNFQPSINNNFLNIILKKKKVSDYRQERSYNLDFGEHGKKSSSCPDYSNSKNGTDLGETVVVVDKGWKFLRWKLNEAQDTLVAQYVKEKSIFKKPIFLVPIFFGITAISLGVWFIYLSPKDDDSGASNKFSEMQNYINGDSIFIEKLDDYKNEWESVEPEVKVIRRGFLDWVMGREKQIDSTEYHSWKKDLKNIESAILIRSLINEKDFEKLKNLIYSEKQKIFQTAIQNIDEEHYQYVKDKLIDLNTKSLSEISNEINSFKIEEKQEVEVQVGHVTSDIDQPETTTNTKKNMNHQSNATEIIQYLKGDKLNKNKLLDYKQNVKDKSLKKSIEIVLSIWNLNGNGISTYANVKESCSNDKNLKDSELYKTLREVKEGATYAGLSTAVDILEKLKSKK